MYPVKEINSIKDYMLRHHTTVAIAESVTSGHLQAAFSLAESAGLFFQGGMTVYNLGQKARHLFVEPIHADNVNCVSELIAEQMALQISRNFSSNYGLGVTGYAAPVPEKNINELFAFYAISQDGSVIRTGKIIADEADALQVQLYFVKEVIHAFSAMLEHS
jgi:nicotinamide-nucleotide amidase